jgi:hypothetical protein
MTKASCRWAIFLALPLLPALLAGCVERQMIITTDPPGAVVFDETNTALSASPADRSFTYYGKYRFKIVKDGYETLYPVENVQPPWYEWLGLDFVSETLLPWTIRDVRRFHYTLQPSIVVAPEQVLEKAIPMRIRGQGTGEEPPPSLKTPTPPPVNPTP